MEQQIPFVVACKMFFGFKEGQKPSDFAAEIRELTAEDRAELTQHFTALGMIIKY